MHTTQTDAISRPTIGNVRKLWPSETGLFSAHLLRLDEEGRRLRFGHAVTDDYIDSYAMRMADSGGIVFGFFHAREMHAAAELHKSGDVWGREAEAAFSVERAYQGIGIGSNLMGRVIGAARNRGVNRLIMCCLVDNAKMRTIARKHDAVLRIAYGEVVGEIVPASPDYFSLLAEAMEDRAGYIRAILELQARLVPRSRSRRHSG